MTVRTALRGLFGGRQADHQAAGTSPNAPPQTNWSNVDFAVERAIETFLGATRNVPSIRTVRAKSSGPTVQFLVTADSPWDEVIDEIERELFPLRKAGALPPLDYDVLRGGEWPEFGYVLVYPS